MLFSGLEHSFNFVARHVRAWGSTVARKGDKITLPGRHSNYVIRIRGSEITSISRPKVRNAAWPTHVYIVQLIPTELVRCWA